ncbi:MAG: LLM class flavin-dependent oxidoreductase [Gammaproteobacteria bacterium]|nr:LLM class flavin-dependent oxidoreductase [Gammaproteobacteria bacterium]
MPHPVPQPGGLGQGDCLGGPSLRPTSRSGSPRTSEARVRGHRRAFRETGAICDEYLRAMKALWTQDQPEFHGEFVSFTIWCPNPGPGSRRIRPAHRCGDAKPVLRRAATLGDGWLPGRRHSAK